MFFPLWYLTRMRTKSPFGPKLRAARVKRQFSQSELGRRSGVDRRYIIDYEFGRNEPTYRNLRKLVDVLGKTLSDELWR